MLNITKMLPINNDITPYKKPSFECTINNWIKTITVMSEEYNFKSVGYLHLQCAFKFVYNYSKKSLTINLNILYNNEIKYKEMFIINNINKYTYTQVLDIIVQEYMNKDISNNKYAILLNNIFSLCLTIPKYFINFFEYNIRHIMEDIVNNDTAMWIFEDDIKDALQLQNNYCSLSDIMNNKIKCNITMKCIRNVEAFFETTQVKNIMFY